MNPYSRHYDRFAIGAKPRGICDVSDGDVLTVDSGAPGGSGTIEGQTKFSWQAPSGGGSQVALEKRLTDICSQVGTATIQAGGNNVGWKFVPRIGGQVCYGASVYWNPGASDRTVRLRLLDVGSATVLRTASVAVPSGVPGIYSVTWADYTMIAGDSLFVDAWEDDNVQLTYFTYVDHGLDIRYGYWGPFIESQGSWFGAGEFGGAESETAFGSPQVFYPVIPLIRNISF